MISIGALPVALVLAAVLVDEPVVTLEKAPHAGFRPQAALDAAGVLHVVQSSRDKRTDLVYVRREPGGVEFSEPIPVHATEGIVAAFSMAVGGDGRVHVLARTNPRYSRLRAPDLEKVRFFDLKYMLYMRLGDDGAAFEPERNLAGETIGFEGAGTILADGEKRVVAFWHGKLVPEPGEATREIFRVVSTDGGATFSEPEAVRSDVEGACQCCPMAGAWGPDGSIVLCYRNSTLADGIPTKDTYALLSDDLGESFVGFRLDPWVKAGCPGSISSVTGGSDGFFLGWRTRGTVHFAGLKQPETRISSPADATCRVPVVVGNGRGRILVVWATAHQRKAAAAGDLHWRVFGVDGEPVSEEGHLPNGVAERWGAPAAFAKPDGSFVILYDGG